jgi:hypothetical protein
LVNDGVKGLGSNDLLKRDWIASVSVESDHPITEWVFMLPTREYRNFVSTSQKLFDRVNPKVLSDSEDQDLCHACSSRSDLAR